MPAFMIAAAHKSSGKTVVSVGLAAALRSRGQKVQTFKKGPDYIDPMWLHAASGRPCYNLDFNTMAPGELRTLFAGKSAGADISLLEANKGLHDGVDPAGSDANAQLARLLGLPVVLVIDTIGITRGIAPLLLGYQAFDRQVNIAGVILNKVGGSRHEGKLRAAVEAYTDIAVLGALGNSPELQVPERHLGLTTPGETSALDEVVARFEKHVGAGVDLERVENVARTFRADPGRNKEPARPVVSRDLRIAIARDRAFGFYYPDDLEAFEGLGVELVSFDALHDQTLPPVDGLFIGGGFPETCAGELSANTALRSRIRQAIADGLPTYAECGGLMYLCRSISWQGKEHEMVGAINATAVMNPRPQGRGYARFATNPGHPWNMHAEFPAHEFHYAGLEGLSPDTRFAHKILRGHGVDGHNDAIVSNNLLAGFCHLRNSAASPWVSHFVEFVRSRKQG